MNRTDFIIPECYVDTNLVETLVCSGGCNHQKGCNQVAKVMQDKFHDRFAVGIIDDDKRHPGYLGEFSEIASSTHLKLYRHPARPHFIILVSPAVDGFILSCAATAHVSLADHGLDPDLKEFTSLTKNLTSNKDKRFKGLFRAMEDVGEMRLMKNLLAYLVGHTYRASDTEIVRIFDMES
ncbi:MAG: hypothetical protein K2H87_07715 [Duncaniella sp.]|nr:hypothetical protein [Duncaniella sp.]